MWPSVSSAILNKISASHSHASLSRMQWINSGGFVSIPHVIKVLLTSELLFFQKSHVFLNSEFPYFLPIRVYDYFWLFMSLVLLFIVTHYVVCLIQHPVLLMFTHSDVYPLAQPSWVRWLTRLGSHDSLLFFFFIISLLLLFDSWDESPMIVLLLMILVDIEVSIKDLQFSTQLCFSFLRLLSSAFLR